MKSYEINRSGRRAVIHRMVSFELNKVEAGRFSCITAKGRGVDIGPGGIGLATDYPLKKGDVLKLNFPIAVGHASLPVYTEVIWSRSGAGGCRAGLRFLS